MADNNSNEDSKKSKGKMTQECPTCHGTGLNPDIPDHELCSECHGSGTIEA